jgi:hypothetical protein
MCPIGQTARPEAAVRNWIQPERPLTAARSIACSMAYGKSFGWQIMVG